MVEVIYELMTEDLKKELHLKAAKYLETTAIQCVSCGGQDTTFVFGLNLQSSELNAENEEDVIAIAGAGSRKRNSRVKRINEKSLKNLSVSMKIKNKASSGSIGGKKISSEPPSNTKVTSQKKTGKT